MTEKRALRQVVLDTETTGMRIEDGNRLIEIGCVEMVNRHLTKKVFHVRINPEREVEEEAAVLAIVDKLKRSGDAGLLYMNFKLNERL